MMKLILITNLLSGQAELFLMAEMRAIDEPEIRALADIESGNKNNKVGKKRELSAYQMLPCVLKEHKKSILTPLTQELAAEIAKEHLQECLILRFRERLKRKASDVDIYLLWNLGYKGYSRAHFDPQEVNRTSRDAAMRYSNLCYMYRSKN